MLKLSTTFAALCVSLVLAKDLQLQFAPMKLNEAEFCNCRPDPSIPGEPVFHNASQVCQYNDRGFRMVLYPTRIQEIDNVGGQITKTPINIDQFCDPLAVCPCPDGFSTLDPSCVSDCVHEAEFALSDYENIDFKIKAGTGRRFQMECAYDVLSLTLGFENMGQDACSYSEFTTDPSQEWFKGLRGQQPQLHEFHGSGSVGKCPGFCSTESFFWNFDFLGQSPVPVQFSEFNYRWSGSEIANTCQSTRWKFSGNTAAPAVSTITWATTGVLRGIEDSMIKSVHRLRIKHIWKQKNSLRIVFRKRDIENHQQAWFAVYEGAFGTNAVQDFVGWGSLRKGEDLMGEPKTLHKIALPSNTPRGNRYSIAVFSSNRGPWEDMTERGIRPCPTEAPTCPPFGGDCPPTPDVELEPLENFKPSWERYVRPMYIKTIIKYAETPEGLIEPSAGTIKHHF